MSYLWCKVDMIKSHLFDLKNVELKIHDDLLFIWIHVLCPHVYCVGYFI